MTAAASDPSTNKDEKKKDDKKEKKDKVRVGIRRNHIFSLLHYTCVLSAENSIRIPQKRVLLCLFSLKESISRNLVKQE